MTHHKTQALLDEIQKSPAFINFTGYQSAEDLFDETHEFEDVTTRFNYYHKPGDTYRPLKFE